MRQGNFSELLGTNIFYSKPTVIYDPSTCPIGGRCQLPAFPGQHHSHQHAEPQRHRDSQHLPGAERPGINGNQNWVAQASQPENQRKETINSDILPSDKDRIQFRRTALAYYELDPFDQNLGMTPKAFNRPNQAGSLAWIQDAQPDADQ